MPARYQFITEEEMINEGEYDDVWPVRPASSARRYQSLADVRSETGRTADVQTQSSRRVSGRAGNERHTIPPRRTATQARVPAVQVPSRVYLDEEHARTTDAYRPSRRLVGGQRRFHWLVFVGLALFVMILGWLALSALGS